jgi:hypothetical protein
MNLSNAGSIRSCGSRNGSTKRVPGSIFKLNSAKKDHNMSVTNLNQSVDELRQSFEGLKIPAIGSPVTTLGKELNFDTEECKDVNDLNKLLQLNEEPNFDRETHNYDFQLEDISILNRHKVVKEDILNLPRPAPKQLANSLVENLKTLEEPINVNGMKIYEPFYVNIWE